MEAQYCGLKGRAYDEGGTSDFNSSKKPHLGENGLRQILINLEVDLKFGDIIGDPEIGRELITLLWGPELAGEVRRKRSGLQFWEFVLGIRSGDGSCYYN